MPSDTKPNPTPDGHHSGPGTATPCSANLLAVPGSVTDSLTGNLNTEQSKRINAIQIEFARDAALLQSRAYDAILKTVETPREE